MKWIEEKREKFDLSLRLDGISRDLLQNNGFKQEAVEEEEQEEEEKGIELSLGLSMNGRFGVDTATSKKLKRSSSISNVVFSGTTTTATALLQARETETESEKHAPLFRSRSLPTAAEEWRRRKEWQTMRRLEAKKKRMEKLKNHPKLLRDNNNNNIVESGGAIPCDAPNGSKQEEEPNKLFPEMPFVSTKGGEGSSKVEGFLYRYKKGEEVRILCVCHGQFLSPAEFVKHGGGADVEHPLKHIVVNPFPLM